LLDVDITDGRLHGWKAIGSYLHVSDRTALRWHERFGIPVHHVGLGGRAHVFAEPAELDNWVSSREGMLARVLNVEPSSADVYSDPRPAAAALTASDVIPPSPVDPRRAAEPELSVHIGRPVRRPPSRAVVLFGSLVVVSLVIGLGIWLGRRAPAAGRPAISTPRRAVSAAARPRSSTLLLVDLRLTGGELFRVEVPDGGLCTLQEVGGPKLALGPWKEGETLGLFLFELTRPQVGGGERARAILRLQPVRDVATKIEALGSTLAFTWTGERTAPLDASEAQICCLACGGPTVCGKRVAGPCGTCVPPSPSQ
jgi:hypothetical protein